MEIKQINDRSQLAAYFSQDAYLHLYSIGDLDDFYWPHTRWFGIQKKEKIERVFLLYTGGEIPVLLAFLDPEEINEEFLEQLLCFMPEQFYAHLTPGLENLFAPTHLIRSHGPHYKMGFLHLEKVSQIQVKGVQKLSLDDIDAIHSLYDKSYPGNWFDPRMLLTNEYFGIWKAGKICSIAGVHVLSDEYQVAALGNIATHPNYRNQGFGTMVTAALCQSLLTRVHIIGLNVKQDNTSALHCYEKLGFEITSSYGEFTLRKKC